ncbi:TetR/AcrR family transcriptional regulator [Streptomyces sp. NPDC050315]|uniref:TetR/AcrR family transcriptional regulator n=1 Tax=Streptomyces sp. NPDC050315 TaxID=3155039 RepID=UPI00342D5C80
MDTPRTAVDRLLVDGSGNRPRADARRNVERLVAAARTAVAEVGVEVSAHDIARRAGVGVGTFYRRVPSREALLEAVLEDVLAEVMELADRALADPDPWHGFTTFATAYVGLRTESCGIGEALGGACGEVFEQTLADLRGRVRALVARAQEAGVLRADVAWQDVPFLLAAVATTGRTVGLTAGERQWERHLRVVLDGLRTPDPVPLPGSPPS